MIPADYQLCLRVRDGDDWAFEELLRRYGEIVEHHARLYSTRGDDHDDILQVGRLGFLKAAERFRADRGSTFRTYAGLSVQRAIFTHIRLMDSGTRRVLNTSVRFEQPVRVRDDETVELGEMLLSSEREDPVRVAIVREDLRERMEIIHSCSEKERSAVALILNGGHYPGVKSDKRYKQVDNALQRVRRKLAAAA